MKVMYFRCNGGHLFRTVSCPFDGWGGPETVEAVRIASSLSQEELSVEALRKKGVAPDLIPRIIVAEFGSTASVFDALAPEALHVDGQVLSADDFDGRFM